MVIVGLKIRNFFASIAPGFFMIGYVIGTGSVTTMAVSGARYGMSLTWALLLSCVFTAFLLIAISRLTIFSGHTLLYEIKKQVHPALAVFIIVGLMITVISSIMGVTAIVAEVFQNWTIPITKNGEGIHPVLTSCVLLGILYGFFWNGRHKTFINILSIVVGLMALCFVGVMFMVMPPTKEILHGIVPSIPENGSPYLVIGGMVGTTMASVCLISRSTLVKEQKWGINDLKTEQRDSIIAMALTFIVSASIIAATAGTLYIQGIQVDNVVEMLYTLEPLVGRFAVSVFAIGILCAGFSSIFPNMVLFPWLLNDYRGEDKPMKNSIFRLLVLVITLTGLTIPLFGGKPVILMVASQAVSPLILPMLIAVVIYLLNQQKVVGDYRLGKMFQLVLYLTLIFSIIICGIALKGFFELFGSFLKG